MSALLSIGFSLSALGVCILRSVCRNGVLTRRLRPTRQRTAFLSSSPSATTAEESSSILRDGDPECAEESTRKVNPKRSGKRTKKEANKTTSKARHVPVRAV